MFLKITNGQPETHSIRQLRRDNPNTSFPKGVPEDTLASYGVYKYTRPDAPVYDWKTSSLADGDFEKNSSGNWVLPFVVKNKPLEEAAQNVRDHRNGLLGESDWVVLMHTEKGTNIPIEWEIYRQALRDITDHANFPWLEDADWPVKPE